MKKVTSSLSLVLFAMVLFISSCGKKTDTSSLASKITFTANGTNYSYPCNDGMIGIGIANTAQAAAADATTGTNNQFILKISPNSSGTSSFTGVAGVEWLFNSKVYYSNASGVNPGTVTLSISGNTATATFSTTLYNTQDQTDSVVITNGKYSGKYFSS